MYRRLTAAAALITAFGAAFAAAPATAQSDETRITITNDQGRETRIRRSVDRNGTQVYGRADVQNNYGRGGQRNFYRQYDPETRTYQRRSQTVTNAGGVSSSSATTVCDGAGNCTRRGGWTGPNGRSGSSVTQSTLGDDNSYRSTTTTTRPNGDIVVRERRSVRTQNGRAGYATTTGPEGTTYRDFERSRTREDGYRRRSTVTGPRGRSAQTDASVQCRQGVCTRYVTQQGDNGRTRYVRGTTERTGRGEYRNYREVVGPDGRRRESRRRVRVERDRN